MIVLRVLNVAIIVLTCSFVGFWSAVFYIGSEYSYAQLKEELLLSFIGRFAGFFILSLLISICLWTLNWLIYKLGLVHMDKKYPLRISITSLAILSSAALLGTAVFFFR